MAKKVKNTEVKDNNLKFLFPKVAAEWHPTQNGDLKPDQFTPGSRKRIWWLCPKGHEYDSIISNRTKVKPTGCPECSGQKVGKDNNLKVLFPKVAFTFPSVASEIPKSLYS